MVTQSPTAIIVAAVLIATAGILFPLNVFHMRSVLGANSTLTTNNNTNPSKNTPGSKGSSQSKISVVASFFPIYEFTKAVGDNRIDLSSLIPFGSEPHDFDP